MATEGGRGRRWSSRYTRGHHPPVLLLHSDNVVGGRGRSGRRGSCGSCARVRVMLGGGEGWKGLLCCEGDARARLAQSVEHETLNLGVVGSSPTSGVLGWLCLAATICTASLPSASTLPPCALVCAYCPPPLLLLTGLTTAGGGQTG